jgi:hypothetical protein
VRVVAVCSNVPDVGGSPGGFAQEVTLVLGVVMLPRVGPEQLQRLIERHSFVPVRKYKKIKVGDLYSAYPALPGGSRR